MASNVESGATNAGNYPPYWRRFLLLQERIIWGDDSEQRKMFADAFNIHSEEQMKAAVELIAIATNEINGLAWLIEHQFPEQVKALKC